MFTRYAHAYMENKVITKYQTLYGVDEEVGKKGARS